MAEEIRTRHGYIICPVENCPMGFFDINSFADHFRSAHIPKDKEATRLVPYTGKRLTVKEIGKNIGCSVDVDVGLVICAEKSCGFALDPAQLRDHLYDHQKFITATEFRALDELKSGLMTLDEFETLYTAPYQPFEAVPTTRRRFECVLCGETLTTWRKLNDHTGDAHPGKAVSVKLIGPFQNVFGIKGGDARVFAEGEMADGEGTVFDRNDFAVYRDGSPVTVEYCNCEP